MLRWQPDRFEQLVSPRANRLDPSSPRTPWKFVTPFAVVSRVWAG